MSTVGVPPRHTYYKGMPTRVCLLGGMCVYYSSLPTRVSAH